MKIDQVDLFRILESYISHEESMKVNAGAGTVDSHNDVCVVYM